MIYQHRQSEARQIKCKAWTEVNNWSSQHELNHVLLPLIFQLLLSMRSRDQGAIGSSLNLPFLCAALALLLLLGIFLHVEEQEAKLILPWNQSCDKAISGFLTRPLFQISKSEAWSSQAASVTRGSRALQQRIQISHTPNFCLHRCMFLSDIYQGHLKYFGHPTNESTCLERSPNNLFSYHSSN